MMASIRELYGKFFAQMTQMSRAAAKIDETNVYQKANPNTKKIMYKLIEDNTLPGSHIGGKENFKAFLEAVKSGKHGLILMEHYSNTDLPALTWLLENDMGAEGKDLADRIVAIAGMKLNEADANVRAFAESFTRVVIYPFNPVLHPFDFFLVISDFLFNTFVYEPCIQGFNYVILGFVIVVYYALRIRTVSEPPVFCIIRGALKSDSLHFHIVSAEGTGADCIIHLLLPFLSSFGMNCSISFMTGS